MIIVSACLAGLKCRYDGNDKARVDLVALVSEGKALALCPEELGGLSTPRPPSEQLKDEVVTIHGEKVTKEFHEGAHKALDKAIEAAGTIENIEKAILKSCSPMCGVGTIYDGSFSGSKTNGDGVFCKLLKKNKIAVEERD